MNIITSYRCTFCGNSTRKPYFREQANGASSLLACKGCAGDSLRVVKLFILALGVVGIMIAAMKYKGLL